MATLSTVEPLNVPEQIGPHQICGTGLVFDFCFAGHLAALTDYDEKAEQVGEGRRDRSHLVERDQ